MPDGVMLEGHTWGALVMKKKGKNGKYVLIFDSNVEKEDGVKRISDLSRGQNEFLKMLKVSRR